MVTNTYYYYIVTSDDVRNGKFEYKLSDFLAMGSSDDRFNEQEASQQYYHKEEDVIYENYIFHVNFAESNLTEDIHNNSLLMELRDSESETLVGVLGIQRDSMVYSVYKDKDATIELDGNLYYPRVDGTTRICIADKVTNVLAKLKMNTIDNTTLATRRL